MPVKVKICGITNVEDAVAAARLGADFVGLNFYPGSPRCVSEGQARLILRALPAQVAPVALFVNEPWERIGALTADLGIRTIQVHRDHLELCPIADLFWIPAFQIRDEESRAEMVRFLNQRPVAEFANAVLADAHVPGSYGGTGCVAPWSLLADFQPRARVDEVAMAGIGLILAGGLTPDNVADAIRIVRPWAVDVASGVESSAGTKDHDKMRRFIDNARSVE